MELYNQTEVIAVLRNASYFGITPYTPSDSLREGALSEITETRRSVDLVLVCPVLAGSTLPLGVLSIAAYVRSKGYSVEIVVGEAPSGEYVILKLDEKGESSSALSETMDDKRAEKAERSELTITVPASWHLSEVRGVHARKVVSYPLENKKTMLMPLAGEVELRFTVGTPFETLSFSHTGSSPALVSLTHISLPSKEIQNEVQLVDGGITFALPSSL